MCYPFQKPLAIIKSGAAFFRKSPLFQMIRECVKRGEPLHAAITDGGFEDGGALTESLMREARQASESILETKKAVGAMFSSGLSSLSAKGSSFASKGNL
ncbi:hypothetical protein QTG54_004226 [Skeletonema marinoi]|uniref:Uncharacterized protein n=1 Tax=Skeletonema marinoi TaxID=267567 RepID=A0AAD8YH07_9STRA|nr:hypothetical protein QTG54_004226 [Skeletonema marinoi]